LLFALGIALAFGACYLRARRLQDVSGSAGSWFSYSLMIAWLALAAVPAVLSGENMPNAIRSILMIPPIFILAAAGGCFLFDRLSRKWKGPWLAPAAAGLLIALCYEAYHSYFEVWARNPNVANSFNIAGVEIANRINA